MNFLEIKNLIGAPYLWWTHGSWIDGPPFYNNSFNVKDVFNLGINCSGVANIFMLSNNFKTPYINNYPGGTYAYYKIFKDNILLFNKKHLIPGSFLLNKYKNKNNQGHIAIFLGDNKIIEAIPNKGVILNDLYPFEFFCDPKNYLIN